MWASNEESKLKTTAAGSGTNMKIISRNVVIKASWPATAYFFKRKNCLEPEIGVV